MDLVYDFVRKNVTKGHQAYIVAPVLTEEGERELTSAVAEAERLKNDIFPDLRLGLLHGRLSPREKEATMARFVAGDLDVLVSTTVVEVGVDVANATTMVVLDAHRYGLARSSHQAARSRLAAAPQSRSASWSIPTTRASASGWRS